MRAGLPLCLLLACSPQGGSPAPTPAPSPAPEPAPAPRVEPPPPASPARRCLPVVAAECGCVYSCGLGTEASPGRWSVAHEHWAPHPVAARVDRWCVDGQCTDAFFGEIVCSGICPPKPADPHCRLVGDRCETSAPAASPAPVPIPASAKKIPDWPFHEWDRAEAITYNHVLYGPGVPLRVYDAEHGWSPKIVERKPITAEQARHAAAWVRATGGEVEVSKCAFPRHAVVLYAGDVPVGTANVCFECGDILVWPDIAAPRNFKKQMTAYKKVMPEWEHLFRDELGFSLKPPPRP